MARYSFGYSRKINTPDRGEETFILDGADSFDEARSKVDHAVNERMIEVKKITGAKVQPPEKEPNPLALAPKADPKAPVLPGK